MSKSFKSILGRFLSDDDSDQDTREFKVAADFYPTDSNYDPQTRLRRRLRALFPHIPIGGLPPSVKGKTEDDDQV